MSDHCMRTLSQIDLEMQKLNEEREAVIDAMPKCICDHYGWPWCEITSGCPFHNPPNAKDDRAAASAAPSQSTCSTAAEITK